MGIADLFRPKYRHSDVRVRAEAVKALTSDDAAVLVQVARTDRDIGVRRIAIEKIVEADVLADIAAAETERSLRDYAGERAAELWQHTACDDDAEAAGAALTGIIKLGDQHALVEVAVHATVPAIRKRAFGELRDPRALAELAKGDAPQDLRLAAVGRIDDGDVLRALAIDTTLKEVGLAAVDKLEDTDRLENVAQKAKNKAVRQRARKIATEMVEAERAKQKPVVPDDVKRRRAERVQLVREVERVVDTFDFDKATPIVTKASESWLELGHTDDEGYADANARFTKTVERFWRRKEVHEQQARSADELRAVEREAAREKEQRAAAAAAAAAAAPAVAPAPEPKPEPAGDTEEKRLARERREAEMAEREARKKEDAERGAALATSLAAMCEDMEKLDSRDTRAIDRLLQQAQKLFDQIGKVPADQRDTLSDRYSAARGKLVVRASELREAEDWARFQNVPKAEALIATAKQMSAEDPSPELGNRLRALQALWKEVGPMPQRRSKELWDQFKSICDQIYDKVKGFRAVESEKFAEVTKIKEALIAEAEALAESTDWAATAEKLKGLQAKWKESGHLPRKQGDELWKRFRAACDKFFERRKPMLDARHAEETENLAKKQALIARAQAVAAGAPGEGGWGKAIGQIKDLQREWKEIGFVPRRDADAVYKAFRAACDALFAKRDDARDSEANTHRAELEAVRAEIDAVKSGGPSPSGGAAAEDGRVNDRVARAIAVRAKVRELDRRELSQAVEDMVRDVIAAEADAVKGTELDPAALHARRAKLVAKAEELLPKTAPAVQASGEPADIAAQLKQAMRSNAFGDLRFSGRDPVEVIDELRAQWADAGPLLDDADRAQAERFTAVCTQVLDAAGAQARRDEPRHDDDRERGGRRRRRDRNNTGDTSAAPQAVQDTVTSKAMPPPAPVEPVAARSEPAVPAPVVTGDVTSKAMPPPAPEPSVHDAVTRPVSIQPPAEARREPAIEAKHDAPTAPAKLPFAPLPAPPLPPIPAPEATGELPRPKSASMLPPMDDLDTGWDMDEPGAEKAEAPTTPSSSEMAGDSATGGDGIDEPGWD